MMHWEDCRISRPALDAASFARWDHAPSRAGPRDAESDLDGTSILGVAPPTQSLEIGWMLGQLWITPVKLPSAR